MPEKVNSVIYLRFNDAVSSLNCRPVASNYGMINWLKRIWKEAVLMWFKIYYAWMFNGQWYCRKWSWPNLGYCLEELRKSNRISARFESGSSRIRISSANHSAATFGSKNVQNVNLKFVLCTLLHLRIQVTAGSQCCMLWGRGVIDWLMVGSVKPVNF